jgi:hypothetical protein
VRRFLKPLTFLLVAAQLLLAVPAIAAVTEQGNEHCAGMAHGAADGAPADCPCCPEGTASMMQCLASCLLAAAAPLHLAWSAPTPAQPSPEPVLPAPRSFESDPPLKPPPIR